MSMIINTQTKGYQMQSTRNYPENWEGEGWLPVPPGLEGKVRENYPYYELVIQDGTLVDVTPTERPEEPEEAETPVSWDALAGAIREGVNAV